MEHLLNFTITEVFEAKKGDGSLVEGKGDYGFWKLYTFYTDKTDKDKFGFMWDEKKPRPESGLKVKHMEYEIKVEGKYTNYNAKKLEVDPTSTPQAIPNAREDMGLVPKSTNDRGINNREVSFYVAYAKDIAVEMIRDTNKLPDNFEAVCSRVAKAGVKLMNESLNNGQPPQVNKTVAPLQDNEKQVPSDTQKEEDRTLRATLKGYAKKDSNLYFETLGLHGAEKAEEVIKFAKEAQDSLLRDLEKAFNMPF